MKKLLALLTVFALLFSFSACTKTQSDSPETTTVTEQNIDETATVTTSAAIAETTSVSDTSAVTDETVMADNPSEWTPDEIIEFYKNAAAKSHPTAKSTQVMVLNELIFNDGDGALAFFVKILEPAIASVVEKNALNFDGITGGFSNLTASDTKSIKAYKSGKYTVIEMTMKNQTDGIHANEHDGTVGHAISVLGDISRVLAEFPQFKVDVDNANIAVNYVNATVKVKINENGIIEKGTWKYTCDPEISHLDISGIMIDKADAEIDYIITVGGGF